MAENFIAEAFSLLAIGLIVIALRWVSRLMTVGFRNLAFDDYLMIVAGALYSAETALAYCVGAKWHGLANNSMTPEERATLSPDSMKYKLIVGGSKNQICGWMVYTSLLWTLKTCMLIFFSRLTVGVSNMKIRIRIGAVLLAVSYLATILSMLLSCQPFHRLWQIYPDPGNLCYPAISTLYVAVVITLNASTDFYLMSVPLPMIWQSRLATKKKWVLSVMFSGGLLVTAAGILRCVLILTAGASGAAQAGQWSIRESFIAVIVGNLPMLYTLVQRIQQYGSGSFNRSNDKKSYPLGSYKTGGSSRMGGKKAKKFQHPLSMPNDTAMDSDERIVVDSKQESGPPPIVLSNDTLPGAVHGGGRQHNTGIRVQTDLHIESSDDVDDGASRKNPYHRFSDSMG
ncbi:MAG: hypothetical protein LQ339_007069 [Xanthoria mediterranea]|nr:MAG: hypothetical protein LQ339_007069 [Xanthoria mediterranea]